MLNDRILTLTLIKTYLCDKCTQKNIKHLAYEQASLGSEVNLQNLRNPKVLRSGGSLGPEASVGSEERLDSEVVGSGELGSEVVGSGELDSEVVGSEDVGSEMGSETQIP
eukprot:573415-Amorphochlora_amoeboformis.AAC.1